MNPTSPDSDSGFVAAICQVDKISHSILPFQNINAPAKNHGAKPHNCDSKPKQTTVQNRKAVIEWLA